MFQTSGACGGQPRTAAEILLSALSQAKTLTSLVNRTLKLSEEEALAALDPAAACQVAEQQRVVARGERLVEITMAINKQLTQLLAIIQENEREREALRRELARSQDQERVNTNRGPQFRHQYGDEHAIIRDFKGLFCTDPYS